MPWLSISTFNRTAFRIAAAAAFLLAAVPGNSIEGPAKPGPDNALAKRTPLETFFHTWSPRLSAEAAPRAEPAEARAEPRRKRVRYSKRKSYKPEALAAQAAQTAPSEQLMVESTPWPVAQDTAGTGSIFPVVVKTVREMIEPLPEAEMVLQNELSDLDLAAGPAPAPQVTLAAATDGRANGADDARASRFTAVAETMHGMAQARWFEPVLLMVAGAIAAVSAMRLFA